MSRVYPDFYERRWAILLDGEPFIDEREDGSESLRCVFEVTHEFGGVISYMKVSIYNLKQETAAANLQTGKVLTLKAGYANNIDIIGQGVIINTNTLREGNDVSFNITCTLGLTPAKKLKPLKSTVEKESSIKTVLEAIAGDTGLKLVMNEDDFKDEPLTKASKTMMGDAIVQLSRLSREYKFDFTISQDKINILKYGKTIGKDVQTLSMKNGMEDVPEFTDVGYNVKSRINP